MLWFSWLGMHIAVVPESTHLIFNLESMKITNLILKKCRSEKEFAVLLLVGRY